MNESKRSSEIKEKSEAYFDSVARNREIIPEPVRCYDYIIKELEMADAGIRIADIGCGTGDMLRRILDVYGNRFRLDGLDLSSESLKMAEGKCEGAVTLLKADVENIPFPDKTMDMLLCMHSFHHYPNPLKALTEMYRILKQGGTLLLVENEYKTLARIKLNTYLFLKNHPSGDIRMYSRQQLLKLVKVAGFDVEKAEHIADHSQLICCKRK